LGTRPAPGTQQPAGTQLWNDVHDGRAPLVVQCSNPAAVLHLLKATEPYRTVQLVLFLTGDSVYETAAELKDRKARVILRPGLERGRMPNTRDGFTRARRLQEAGVELVSSRPGRPPVVPAVGRFGAAPPQPEEAAETTPVLTVDQDFPLFPVAVLVKTGLPRQ